MDCQYRGEGNCSLVVADSTTRKVYRLLKKHYTKKFVPWGDTSGTKSKARVIRDDLQEIISYMRWVMQPLLSANYVVIPNLVEVDEEFVHNIVEQVSSQRPVRRLQKPGDMVDEQSSSALILPDFCFVPSEDKPTKDTHPTTISIEIKPKKAFITSEVGPECSFVCKFCMHQHLKCQSGQWPKTSYYCPLDLFSGTPERMKHALQSLMKTPQNNFKLWKDGEDMYSAETKENLEDILLQWFNNPALTKNRVVNKFLDMVIEILLMSVSQDDPPPHSDLTRSPALQHCQSSSFTHTENGRNACQWLYEGSVLERVFAAQLLDDLDITGIYPLYLQLKRHLKMYPNLRSEWGFDGHFPQNWLLDSVAFKSLEENSIEWIVQKVKRFLVSKTLQDCSIMVAVRPLNNKEMQEYSSSGNHGNNVLEFEGSLYKISVALVDLDPKPLDKITKYFEQDTDIRASFQDSVSSLSHSVRTCMPSHICTTVTTTSTSSYSDSKKRSQGQTELF